MRSVLNILALAATLFAAYVLMSGTLLPAPLATLPLALRGVLALAMLTLGIRVFAAGRNASGPHTANARRKRGWLDLAAASGVWLVLHAAFLWLLGATPRPIEWLGLAAEPWLRPEQAIKRSELDAEAAEAGRRGNWLWQDRRSRALPTRTNLRPGNRPEVFLRFDTPEDAAAMVNQQAYLSSFALSNYAHGRWSTTDAAPTPVDATNDGASQFATPPARADFRLIAHEVFLGDNAAGQNVLTALQGVESAEIEPLERHDDGFIMLPDSPETSIGYQYRAQSRPLVLADLPPNMPIPLSIDTPAWLLEIPANTRIATHLTDQAREIAGENPTIQSLATLEQWLRSAYEYSLQTTNPHALDPLENFLFSERAGHCEHFAMTAALMVRTLGIPSRVAYGWAGGTWYDASELMVFRSREAHAWTEILLPEFGWVVMDPTPPSGIDGTRSRIAPPDEKPPDPIEELAYDEEAENTTRIDLAATWLLGIFGVPVLALLTIRARGRQSLSDRFPASSSPSGGDHRGTGYLAAWFVASPPGSPGETLRRQIRRMEDPPPFADHLIAYHYRIQYTRAGRDPAIERDLERTIRKWHHHRKSKHFRE